MKGSLYRKRYILLKEEAPGGLDGALNQIRMKFGSRVKFREGIYAIVLTDQFQKDALCRFVNADLKGASVVTVSGTIKKCKEKVSG